MTTVRVELDRGRGWEVYNSRTVAGRGSNARRHARRIAYLLRQQTLGTLAVRVVVYREGEEGWADPLLVGDAGNSRGLDSLWG